MAQGGEVSLQPSELVTWLEAKLSEKSIRLNSKQRQALEELDISGKDLLLFLESSDQLTPIGFAANEIFAIKCIVQSLQRCYVVRATFFGAKQRKGVRASVFKNAQSFTAYYHPVQSESIWYDDGDDLLITLLFKKGEHAVKFQDFLTMWYIENPMVVKSKDVSVEEELKVMYVEECKLRRVFLHHCDPKGSESSIQSLGEFLGDHSSVSASAVSSSDPMAQFQSIEKPGLFRFCKPYRMHIKSKAEFPNLANEESNILVGTWTPFHQFFDGQRTEDDIPQIAIRPLPEGKIETVMVGEPSQKRQRVDLSLEFRHADAAKIMAENLKVDSVKLSDKAWKTSVYVPNAEIFCDCLKWKYEQTTKVWQNMDED